MPRRIRASIMQPKTLEHTIHWPQEDNEAVVFVEGTARFKTKTVIPDNPVLQDVFVYAL